LFILGDVNVNQSTVSKKQNISPQMGKNIIPLPVLNPFVAQWIKHCSYGVTLYLPPVVLSAKFVPAKNVQVFPPHSKLFLVVTNVHVDWAI